MGAHCQTRFPCLTCGAARTPSSTASSTFWPRSHVLATASSISTGGRSHLLVRSVHLAAQMVTRHRDTMSLHTCRCRNAVTLEEFWRKWNIPVHEWMHRHVFLESLKVRRAATLRFCAAAVAHGFPPLQLWTARLDSLERANSAPRCSPLWCRRSCTSLLSSSPSR